MSSKLHAGESRLAPTQMKRGSVLASLPVALASAEEGCEMAEKLEARGKGSKPEEILCEGSQGGKGHGPPWEAADGVASGLPAS